MMGLAGELKAIIEFRNSIEGKASQGPPEKEPKDKELNIRVVYDRRAEEFTCTQH
jgi:hypothetical protein